jgi:lipid A 3-O-deacylase
LNKRLYFTAPSILCLTLLVARAGFAQTLHSPQSSTQQPPSITETYLHPLMEGLPWEYGLFLDGGFGTTGETSDHFLNAGLRIGKVLTGPAGPGIIHGQFEYAVEVIPYWQAFTPQQTYFLVGKEVTTGGTYTGLSLTPIILRWNLTHWHRVMPWLQGAGGLLWTNHKFPPNGPRGTSVWNFEPQFGLGVHYFVRPRRSIDFAANAVHISNASLGDANPGVNATVQFQIGYSWWK